MNATIETTMDATMESLPESGTITLDIKQVNLTASQVKKVNKLERLRAAEKAAKVEAQILTMELVNELGKEENKKHELVLSSCDAIGNRLSHGKIKWVPKTKKWIPACEGHWKANKDGDHFRLYASRACKVDKQAIEKAINNIKENI
jgi:hypothetical protein